MITWSCHDHDDHECERKLHIERVNFDSWTIIHHHFTVSKLYEIQWNTCKKHLLSLWVWFDQNEFDPTGQHSCVIRWTACMNWQAGGLEVKGGSSLFGILRRQLSLLVSSTTCCTALISRKHPHTFLSECSSFPSVPQCVRAAKRQFF